MTFYTAWREEDGTLVRDHTGCESYYNAQYSLGWDLDDNGSFESGACTSATFGAALARRADDGAHQGVCGASRRHLDGRGRGGSIPVASEARRSSPVIASGSVEDPLGYDLDGGSNVALVGLPVNRKCRSPTPGSPTPSPR